MHTYVHRHIVLKCNTHIKACTNPSLRARPGNLSAVCERESVEVLHVCTCPSHESYGSHSFLKSLKILLFPMWFRLLMSLEDSLASYES